MTPEYIREGEQLPLERPKEYLGNTEMLMDYLQVKANHRQMQKDDPSPAMASVLEAELDERREALKEAGVLTEANNDGVGDAVVDQFLMLAHLYHKNYAPARDFRNKPQTEQVQRFYEQAKSLLVAGYCAMPGVLGKKLLEAPGEGLRDKMLREHFSA